MHARLGRRVLEFREFKRGVYLYSAPGGVLVGADLA